jgi:LemA protein
MGTTLIVILVIVVVLGIVFAALYNGLVKLRNVVQESWAQIDVELKRRHDLIGNLVETVKGYASHERGTLDEVTRARAAAMAPNQGPAQAAQSEGELSRALVNQRCLTTSRCTRQGDSSCGSGSSSRSCSCCSSCGRSVSTTG